MNENNRLRQKIRLMYHRKPSLKLRSEVISKNKEVQLYRCHCPDLVVLKIISFLVGVMTVRLTVSSYIFVIILAIMQLCLCSLSNFKSVSKVGLIYTRVGRFISCQQNIVIYSRCHQNRTKLPFFLENLTKQIYKYFIE